MYVTRRIMMTNNTAAINADIVLPAMTPLAKWLPVERDGSFVVMDSSGVGAVETVVAS